MINLYDKYLYFVGEGNFGDKSIDKQAKVLKLLFNILSQSISGFCLYIHVDGISMELLEVYI